MHWVKYPGNPFLAFDDAAAEAWEDINLYAPRWIYDPDAPAGEEYRVFYSAGDSYAANLYQVGIATGATLETVARKTASNPVISPALFTHITAVGCAELCPWIKDGPAGEYGGYIAVEVAGNLLNIYEVESDDRGLTWSVVGSGPLIDRGASSADDVWANKPALSVQTNGDHWIYYTGNFGSASATTLCLAKRTGSTGAATKVTGNYGGGSKAGVILEEAGFYLLYPCPLLIDGKTYLFLQKGPPGGPYTIHLYVSDDGETGWRDTGIQLDRDGWNEGGFADFYIGTPWIGLDEHGTYKMTYSGRKKSEEGTTRYNRLGVATLEQYIGGGASR